MVKIMIASSRNYLWRAGAIAIIKQEPELSVVAEVSSGRQIVATYHKTQPDVILLDTYLANETDCEIVRMFFEGSEPTNILLVGNHFKEEEIITAFQHGVKGYILTTCIQEQLIDAIETVSHNDEWWSPEVTFKMLHMATSRNIARVAKPACSQIITQRELEILGLMVRGHNNTEISDLLSLSIYTVQNHICSIYSKLGIRERLKVVHYAIQNGLVEV